MQEDLERCLFSSNAMPDNAAAHESGTSMLGATEAAQQPAEESLTLQPYHSDRINTA